MTKARPAIELIDEGARLLLDAAIEHAQKMGALHVLTNSRC